MGFLKNHLSGEDTPQARRPGTLAGEQSNQELLDPIEDYRQGLVLPIVLLTLLKLHLKRHPVPDWVLVTFMLHQLRHPFFPSGAPNVAESTGLLKGRGGDRMPMQRLSASASFSSTIPS